MREIIKSLLIDALAVGNVFPTAQTDRQAVHALMQRLHPRRPRQGLIRLGPQGDGGYLVPDDLGGIAACFSPGVSLISGFERDCAERGLDVFLADASVEQPAEPHARFHFTRKFVGVTTSEVFMTMDDWVAAACPGAETELLLQMDIEGYEYETILAMSDRLMRRFRIIVAEFHDLDQLWNRAFFRLAARAFEKILQTHTCVHIHPNNIRPPMQKAGLSIPPLAEFTFLRSDRLAEAPYATVFPHPLDADTTDFPSFALPACWYRAP